MIWRKILAGRVSFVTKKITRKKRENYGHCIVIGVAIGIVKWNRRFDRRYDAGGWARRASAEERSNFIFFCDNGQEGKGITESAGCTFQN